ncbi:uncharacterized protein [Gossypium hirsutum]|uniref:Uncharacterized protein n=1 Tax=Gossypium hirsutum TaxID=3635 RepID=A0ABM3AM46_GOSHI|nr:uncharacterized protein LOC121220307 [Gossypium hirsutum]
MLMNKLPPKLKDPRSFTISCSIGYHYVGKTLCDLGENINIIPISILRKLGIRKARPIIVTLQLADRSCAHPKATVRTLIDVQKEKFAKFCHNNSDDDEDPFELTEAKITGELGELMETKQFEYRQGRSFKSLDFSNHSFKPPKPSIKDLLSLELKPLPLHLKYAYLGDTTHCQ